MLSNIMEDTSLRAQMETVIKLNEELVQTIAKQARDHFERRERVVDLDDEAKVNLKYIGDSVTERMRFERPQVYIERVIRRKYVVAGQPEQGVKAAPAPLAIARASGVRQGGGLRADSLCADPVAVSATVRN